MKYYVYREKMNWNGKSVRSWIFIKSKINAIGPWLTIDGETVDYAFAPNRWHASYFSSLERAQEICNYFNSLGLTKLSHGVVSEEELTVKEVMNS